ncbi:hypothetical protein B0H16DRAFT_1480873 [Mycena metata]|uniref:Uncharacterized protein n=1 Tax=Mycena metata TaxID=1033252 RepID=A0AAD7H1Z5_9AGAR|nr:hypothetical protein B0H16DRAFT_1480873 [Mycena metata]
MSEVPNKNYTTTLLTETPGKGKVPPKCRHCRHGGDLAAVLAALWRQFGGGTFESQSCRAHVVLGLVKVINNGKEMPLQSGIQLYLQHLKLAWRTEWQGGGKFGGGGNVGGNVAVAAKLVAKLAAVLAALLAAVLVSLAAMLAAVRGDGVTCWRALLPLSNGVSGLSLRAVHLDGSLAALKICE